MLRGGYVATRPGSDSQREKLADRTQQV